MKKKINHRILSISPYISTSWKNINTVYVNKKGDSLVLVIALHNGTIIDIPDLDSELINQVFAAHANYIESELKEDSSKTSPKKHESSKKTSDNSLFFGIPIQASKFEGIDGNALLQHNPELSHLSPMPQEIIQKITSITKAFGMQLDQLNTVKTEPHCNCPYCQIVRAIQQNENEEMIDEKTEDYIVTEEDLRFRDWDIKQEGDQLYIVTNPLNAEEHYQVFLGNPIGCTCGEKNCEHLRTVLNS